MEQRRLRTGVGGANQGRLQRTSGHRSLSGQHAKAFAEITQLP